MPLPRGPIGGPGGRGGGPGSSREEYRRAVAYLHALAEKSGARFYNGDTLQNVTEAFAAVAEELRRQYSLSYYPKAVAQEGQRRQIKVRVNEPNLVVKSRDSYIYSQKRSSAKDVNEQQLTEAGSNSNHLSGTR